MRRITDDPFYEKKMKEKEQKEAEANEKRKREKDNRDRGVLNMYINEVWSYVKKKIKLKECVKVFL